MMQYKILFLSLSSSTILIIKNDISYTFSSKDGETPLLVASRHGHLAVVQELLNKEANKEAMNNVSIIVNQQTTRCIDNPTILHVYLTYALDLMFITYIQYSQAVQYTYISCINEQYQHHCITIMNS